MKVLGSIPKLYRFNGGGSQGLEFGSFLALPTGFFNALCLKKYHLAENYKDKN